MGNAYASLGLLELDGGGEARTEKTTYFLKLRHYTVAALHREAPARLNLPPSLDL